MANQMTSLTDPQRLAMLLQSTDQNQVLPQQQIPTMQTPSSAPNSAAMGLVSMALKQKYGGVPGMGVGMDGTMPTLSGNALQMANDRQYGDMNWNK
jgi:hypothetical protein